jgi:short-chain Z-isoprenyl diphosphate synthase
MDGNRRWARAAGYANPSVGHRFGAEHLEEALRWCERRGIEHLTVYVLSADNIRRRAGAEIDYLMHLLETVVPEKVADAERRWRLHVSGDLRLLPDSTARALQGAVEQTRQRPCHLTLAIGYDGRDDIVRAARTALRAQLADGATATEVVDRLGVEEITDGLVGGPVKDIDLVIRTSGESRLSGFFPWQSAGAELFLSPKMWPAFTEADFVEALRHYARKRAPSGG